MRPLKISRDELLNRCADTFRRLGYNGATMDSLSAACGLTKASFYHHYPNKEALLRDVLSWTHERMREILFAIADDESMAPAERLQRMGSKAQKLFRDNTIGCLMGVVAVDATYARSELMEPIRAFMDEWAAALARIFSEQLPDTDAAKVGRQLVADYEGAILMARIYGDASYIDGVTERALTQLRG
ncbi:TetR/AcrR family transcriptional regulator [Halopseudomonas maritima]|uniref:TetR/AcrR family transcriptional regulator n=1 Tax=Halopseudomonas maritima TaxID=2918528 RepID=UPI001EEA7971|nr:TetR/AcrR family transcriptional regulator [Halopseudomonas maritima]UJJ32697.1 TetR/AcrR family transcriptional regulator [Halopseudomonas maritima]